MKTLVGKFHRESRCVKMLVLCTILSAIILTPLRIGGYGYLPIDDALRHSAKVVSGKNWNEILVLRDEIKMDSHPGWHAILGGIFRLTNCTPDSLVFFSFVILFVVFCLLPVFVFDRPEAWVASLLTVYVSDPGFIIRILYGRPYIFTMAVLLFICLTWTKLRTKETPYITLAILSVAIALSTWIHCAWYLFVLPIFSFCLAREWRVACRITIASVLGIMIGALLSGNPFMFFEQTFLHAVRAFGGNPLQRMLVSEFRAFTGDAFMVIVLSGMLIWRKVRGEWDMKAIDNPLFLLTVTGWVLGFVAIRFWLDWGLPAACLWIALELQKVFKKSMPQMLWKRFILTVVISGTFFLAVTADVGSRWTSNLTKGYLIVEDPEHADWLPDDGGIVYSNDMTIFYDTFFKNPKGNWRYMLGFEPAMMPPEDLAIFRKIQWNLGAYKSFQPWINKMRPQDRVVLRQMVAGRPNIPELEWKQLVRGIWVGRLPKKNE